MLLRSADTLSGQEGKAVANIGGVIQDMFYVKSLEANVDKNKAELKVLGKKGTQHKTIGWNGSGTMTIFYLTSVFRVMMLRYVKTGVDTNFTITVVNEDKGSTIGKQTVVLYNCNIDSTVLAKLDVESDALEEEVSFTFDDFDILDRFGQPVI